MILACMAVSATNRLHKSLTIRITILLLQRLIPQTLHRDLVHPTTTRRIILHLERDLSLLTLAQPESIRTKITKDASAMFEPNPSSHTRVSSHGEILRAVGVLELQAWIDE